MHPVPAAVDALVALLRSANTPGGALDAVRIDDGPPPQDFDDKDAIGVGVMLDEIDALSSTPSYQLGSGQEPVDVQCVAQSWTGDADPQVWSRARARVFALLDAVGGLLAQHPDLGAESVSSATVDRWSLRWATADDGQLIPLALLSFTVRVHTYRRR